jgi:hypothetical protein
VPGPRIGALQGVRTAARAFPPLDDRKPSHTPAQSVLPPSLFS